jgi:hypothetical protein
MGATWYSAYIDKFNSLMEWGDDPHLRSNYSEIAAVKDLKGQLANAIDFVLNAAMPKKWDTWVLFVPAADWLAHHDVGPVKGSLHETAVDNARGRLLTLGAGLVATVALVFTARNFNLLRRNSERADQWQQRTHELTEQGQVTDRYGKAIEQLGSDKLDVRIGGIYALERVARDSRRDQPTVVEVLAAFIREHSRELWPQPGPDDDDDEVLGRLTRPDVQAAATVLRRRDRERDVRRIDLSGANLSRADLAGEVSRTIFRASAVLGADFRDADFRHADLCPVRISLRRTSSART